MGDPLCQVGRDHIIVLQPHEKFGIGLLSDVPPIAPQRSRVMTDVLKPISNQSVTGPPGAVASPAVVHHDPHRNRLSEGRVDRPVHHLRAIAGWNADGKTWVHATNSSENASLIRLLF